jgi:hypothetical protein
MSMPGKSQIGGVDLFGLAYLVGVLFVAFLPMLLGRGGSPPGQSDSDSDDGWGRGPEPPSGPPIRPRGGIPLEDAEPSRIRLRGHDRLTDLLPARDRRPARETERRRVRT